MSNLFGESLPLDVRLRFRLRGPERTVQWDVVATNPDTGDLLAMDVSEVTPRSDLGPALSRALLRLQEIVQLQESGELLSLAESDLD